MIYGNNSSGAVLAMECHRTGDYGEDDYYDEPCCDLCGDDGYVPRAGKARLYKMDGQIFCRECLKEYLMSEFKGAYSVV